MESRSAVYRSATPDDAVLAYHNEARELATSGYVPTAEQWSSENGQQVLTVEYAYIPDQAPALLAALSAVVVTTVDAQPVADAPLPAAPSDAAWTPIEPPPAAPSDAAWTSIEPPVAEAPLPAAPSAAAWTPIEPPPAVPSDAAWTSIEPPVAETPLPAAPSAAAWTPIEPPPAAPSDAAWTSIEPPVAEAPPRAASGYIPPTSIEQPVRTPATSQRSIRLIPMAVVAVLVIAASLAAAPALFHKPGTSGAPPADGGGIPATGTIWFGSSFDATSNLLLGRADSLPLGKQVAIVAHLNRAATGELVEMQLDVGGTPATLPGGEVIAGARLIGEVLPATAIYQAGTLTVRVVDAGGSLLAIGTVTILP